jgi:hypothetical protein
MTFPNEGLAAFGMGQRDLDPRELQVRSVHVGHRHRVAVASVIQVWGFSKREDGQMVSTGMKVM